MTTTTAIELPSDFDTMDETGLPWAFLDQAVDSARVVPGAHLVAGSGTLRAVVVVVDVTDDGIVHVCDGVVVLGGSVRVGEGTEVQPPPGPRRRLERV